MNKNIIMNLSSSGLLEMLSLKEEELAGLSFPPVEKGYVKAGILNLEERALLLTASRIDQKILEGEFDPKAPSLNGWELLAVQSIVKRLSLNPNLFFFIKDQGVIMTRPLSDTGDNNSGHRQI